MQDKKQYYIDLTSKYIKMYSALESACLWGKKLVKDLFDLHYATSHASKKMALCIYNVYVEELDWDNDNFEIILAWLWTMEEYQKLVDAYISMTCLEDRISKLIDYISRWDVSVWVTDVSVKKE